MSQKYTSAPSTKPVKKSAARFSAKELALMFTHLQSLQPPTRDGLQRLLEMILHQETTLSEETLLIMWRVAQAELIVVAQETERSELNALRAELRRLEESARALQAKFTLPHYQLMHADSPQMRKLANRMVELLDRPEPLPKSAPTPTTTRKAKKRVPAKKKKPHSRRVQR